MRVLQSLMSPPAAPSSSATTFCGGNKRGSVRATGMGTALGAHQQGLALLVLLGLLRYHDLRVLLRLLLQLEGGLGVFLQAEVATHYFPST